jgi:UDP-N-acetylglucosamine--N-acetylmuramyl-(pentapeptide) pyrophosphoryl-undecaprenol N-acetylglucosamine transferase
MRSPSLSRRVTLAGGYTAGDVMPMIAVGKAFAEYRPNKRIIALGQSGGLEAGLMPERGFAQCLYRALT